MTKLSVSRLVNARSVFESWVVLSALDVLDTFTSFGITSEKSSAGWPSFGEHVKAEQDSAHRWMNVGLRSSYL